MKYSIKDFLSKFDQIHRKLRIWSNLLKKSLMENFIFLKIFYLFIYLFIYFLFIYFFCSDGSDSITKIISGKS